MKSALSRIAAAVVLLFVTSVSVTAEPDTRNGQEVPGRYIILLRSGASAAAVAADHGLSIDHTYSSIRGFSAAGAAGKLQALQRDPRVLSAEPDRFIVLSPIRRVETQFHTNDFETLTSGIDRIDADLNPRTDVSAVGIAIIDTGIWKTHVDLNVAGGNNCTGRGTSKYNDDNGHGTHVAGIAAAKTGDNHGVRGVSPNARLYAVKVLDRNGSGFLSWVICGVDWVSANAAGIKVANMSLGFQGSSSALNTAIANSVGAGVTYAVAAGNSSSDASLFSPASHPDVITVSAMGDSDGKCGGLGAATSNGADDTFATFSNRGSAVEIAAPGVDIESTYKGDKQNPGGLYASMSGTSMASPHVAGAAAQYKASNPAANPLQVKDALLGAAVAAATTCTAAGDGGPNLAVVDGGAGGFSGDPDSFAEPLLYAKSL